MRRADIHRTPLGDAGLVICYLHPGVMERLRPGDWSGSCRAGCLVCSNCLPVPGWRPVGWLGDEMDLYRVPELPLPRRA